MRSDILRRLIEAHTDGDDAGLRRAALQLAASESASGHARIADDLRALVARMPPPTRGNVVDIAQPRGELADILEGGRVHPDLACAEAHHRRDGVTS